MKTKKEYFEKIIKILYKSDDLEKNELIYFLNNQIASVDKKAAGAKKRNEQKKKEQDDLKNKILSILETDKTKTIQDIIDILKIEVSKQKIVSRLTQLEKENLITKEIVRTDDGIFRVYKKK